MKALADLIDCDKLNERMSTMTGNEQNTAYHEAGHAVAAYLSGHIIESATIVPEGETTGHVMSWPNTTARTYKGMLRQRQQEMMKANMVVCLAGREAEAIHFGRKHRRSSIGDWRKADSIAWFLAGGHKIPDYDKECDDGPRNKWGVSAALLAYHQAHSRADCLTASTMGQQRYLAQKLVAAHRSEIDAVACALIVNLTLSGDQVEELVSEAQSSFFRIPAHEAGSPLDRIEKMNYRLNRIDRKIEQAWPTLA